MPSPTLLSHIADLILAGALLSLLRRGVAKRYKVWWVFLVLQLLRDLALAAIPFDSNRYASAFMVSEVTVDVVLAASVYEWFRLLAGHYPGIKLAGTWFLNIGLGISFLVCLATLGRDWRLIDWSAPELYLILLTKRVIVGILALFMVFVFGAFCLYRVRVRPNVIWHGLLLTAYLWLQSALSVADSWSRLESVHLTNSVRSIGVAALYLGWAVLLTRRGEEVEIEAKLTEEERFQLDRLNDELLALARRTMRGV